MITPAAASALAAPAAIATTRVLFVFFVVLVVLALAAFGGGAIDALTAGIDGRSFALAGFGATELTGPLIPPL